MKTASGILLAGVACLGSGYLLSKNNGIHEGFASASSQYENWAIGMMLRNPDLRLDAIIMARNGARM